MSHVNRDTTVKLELKGTATLTLEKLANTGSATPREIIRLAASLMAALPEGFDQEGTILKEPTAGIVKSRTVLWPVSYNDALGNVGYSLLMRKPDDEEVLVGDPVIVEADHIAIEELICES